MKSIYSVLVAVSLINPASAGRVREALEEFENPNTSKPNNMSDDDFKELALQKQSSVHVAMSSRRLRYMMYDMQLTSAIARCAGLWALDRPQYEKILDTLVILRRTITLKLKDMKSLHDQTIAAFEQGQGLATYNRLKSSKPKISRVQAEEFEKQWKKYADALHKNKSFLASLSSELGEEFSQIEDTDETLKDHLATVAGENEMDDSLKDGKNNLLEHLKTFGKPLNVFDFVKARIKHFSVAGYEADGNEGVPSAVVQAFDGAQGHDAHSGERRSSQRQQQQGVQSNDDDEVVPPAHLSSHAASQDDQQQGAVSQEGQSNGGAYQEESLSPYGGASPREAMPTSSMPASPQDSPPLQRRNRSDASAAATSSAQPTPVAHDPFRSHASTSSASTAADTSIASTGGRGGKAGRGRGKK